MQCCEASRIFSLVQNIPDTQPKRTNPSKCPSYVSTCVKTWRGEEVEKEWTWPKSHLCQTLCQTASIVTKIPYNVYTQHRQAKWWSLGLSNKMAYLLKWLKCHLLRSDLVLIGGIPFLSLWDVPTWCEWDSQWPRQDEVQRRFIITTTLWRPWPLPVLPPLKGRLGRWTWREVSRRNLKSESKMGA